MLKNCGFEIIDAHIHPFIEPENNLRFYSIPATMDEMVAGLKQNGVSRACGSVIKGAEIKDFEYIKKVNRDALKLRDMYQGFIIPGMSVHAAFTEESCREVEEMYKTHGVRWLGELVSYMCGTTEYSCSSLFPVYELAQELDMPVNIHQQVLTDIEKILVNFPKLKIVMAHPDEKSVYTKRVELMRKYENLHLDISGGGIFRWGMLKWGVDQVGSERFLFGSDYPICSVGQYVQGVLSEPLTDTDRAAIFSGNFKRLAKIR